MAAAVGQKQLLILMLVQAFGNVSLPLLLDRGGKLASCQEVGLIVLEISRPRAVVVEGHHESRQVRVLKSRCLDVKRLQLLVWSDGD